MYSDDKHARMIICKKFNSNDRAILWSFNYAPYIFPYKEKKIEEE